MVNIFGLTIKLVPTKEIKFVSDEIFEIVGSLRENNRAISDQKIGNHWVSQRQSGQGPAPNVE